MSDAPESPKVPGREPTFRHLDDPDVAWQQVKRQRNRDGSESSVWEKWLAFSPDPQYLSLYAKYDPGMMVRRHGHYSPHVLFVIEGEIFCGDRRCPAGTHIELPLGAAFGPFRAGPDGATLFEVMMGDPARGVTSPRCSTRCSRSTERSGSPMWSSTTRPGSRTSAATGSARRTTRAPRPTDRLRVGS